MDNIKTEASRTGNEFRDLKNLRMTPSSTASTGQPLTCTWWKDTVAAMAYGVG